MATVREFGYTALQHVEHGLTDGSIHHLQLGNHVSSQQGSLFETTHWSLLLIDVLHVLASVQQQQASTAVHQVFDGMSVNT